ncbi:MAG TPA: amidohydrolase [Actinomycetota bacterium]|nr:amidohydrolase [Actinomycetota bacterium]
MSETDPDGPADVVFTGGAVYTVDPARTWAQAVAVKGGRILTVGTDQSVADLIEPKTEVHDLRGRMLLPGFQDAHVHPPSGGLEMLECNLNEAYTREGYERIVADYASEHPDVEWIRGGGWSMDSFPGGTPTKEILDRIILDRPVYLPNRDGHGAWVNSRALELAGITGETPDPPDGRIERDDAGEPSGTLHEGAMDLVDKLMPPVTEAEWEEGLRVAQQYLHSLGITAWQDAIVGGPYDTIGAYTTMAGRDALTARVVGSLWWDRHRGEEQIDELVTKRERSSVGRFRATTVKIMQDGVIENFMAGVLEPYLGPDGTPTSNRGMSFVDPELLKASVTGLDAEGFQVHIHAIGERAVREALDALEAARAANGSNDHRHHIAHIQVVHPDDIPRFEQLGVVANAQPLWATLEGQMVDLTIPFLGPERSGWQYPFASLVRSGARLAFGSDWSVSSPNPMWEMAVAVHRKVPRRHAYLVGERATKEAFLPDERIDLATAIHAFTMGSAYVNHLDDVTGSIEVGKEADLVVVDRNLFDMPLDDLADAKVQLTMVAGEPVFVDPSFA